MPNGTAVTKWKKPCACWAKGESPEKVLEAMSCSLTNKFLHAPTHALNEVQSGDREAFLEVIHRLYHLHNDE